MKKLVFLLLFLFGVNKFVFPQQKDTITIASWNLENLFDTVDDPNKNDVEFTPSSRKEWTMDRLNTKLYNLSRVISSINNNKGPDILGVCEVEHKALLDSMIVKFLHYKNYKVAYKESPDNRGIDNGLIYNTDLFSLMSVKGDTIKLDDGYPTRLILNVNLLTKDKDTLIVYVNHWPSRRGGEKSEKNRVRAAETLKHDIESHFKRNSKSKIIIIGDFNDNPNNNSILKELNAVPFYCDSTNYIETYRDLYNLAFPSYAEGLGTYKYRDNWNMLDQVIISGALIDSKNVHYICNSFEVYKPLMMVTRSGKYKGAAFPTYGGSRYLGGYSDHYPVVTKFIFNMKK